MHSGLIADLRRYRMSHPLSGDSDAPLWPGRKLGSHVLNYDHLLNAGSFRPALRALGMPDMRVRDLRHTAAYLWLAAEFKPYEVSQWLGHANVTTTDSIYAHLYPSDYTEHVARFDAFVGVTP